MSKKQTPNHLPPDLADEAQQVVRTAETLLQARPPQQLYTLGRGSRRNRAWERRHDGTAANVAAYLNRIRWAKESLLKDLSTPSKKRAAEQWERVKGTIADFYSDSKMLAHHQQLMMTLTR